MHARHDADVTGKNHQKWPSLKEEKICYKMIYYTLSLSQSSEIRIFTGEKLTLLKGSSLLNG